MTSFDNTLSPEATWEYALGEGAAVWWQLTRFVRVSGDDLEVLIVLWIALTKRWRSREEEVQGASQCVDIDSLVDCFAALLTRASLFNQNFFCPNNILSNRIKAKRLF